MKINKEKSGNRKNLFSIILAVEILFALCRNVSFSIEQVIIANLLLLFLVTVIKMIECEGIKLLWIDFFIAVQPLYFFNMSPAYGKSLVVMWIIAYMVMLVTRLDYNNSLFAIYIILFFSACNAVINIIQIINEDFYFRVINFILRRDAIDGATNQYYSKGLICGLSGHYSRNAYFCVAGILVLIALIWSRLLSKKLHRFCVCLLIIEIALLLRIGKRGHLLFLIIAVLFVSVLIQKNISKKVTKLFLFITVVLVGYYFIITFVPSLGYAFERLFNNSSDDISSGRFDLYRIAYNYFKQNPIFGKGYGYFTTHVLTSRGSPFAGVHNDYLQWLCELGIVGFVINSVFTIGIYYFGIKILKSIRQNDEVPSKVKFLAIWAMLFQTFVITYSMTGIPHYDYEINVVYYLSCGLILGMYIELKSNIGGWKKKSIPAINGYF